MDLRRGVGRCSDDRPFDGLVGLAKSGLSNQKTLTPIEALKEAGLVNSAQVGYHLSRTADGLNDGEITFGSVEYVLSILLLPVGFQGF